MHKKRLRVNDEKLGRKKKKVGEKKENERESSEKDKHLSVENIFEYTTPWVTPISKLKDYYKILDIPAITDDKHVRKAYLKLSRNLHPDKNGGVEYSTYLVDVQEAYDNLSSWKKRTQYAGKVSKELLKAELLKPDTKILENPLAHENENIEFYPLDKLLIFVVDRAKIENNIIKGEVVARYKQICKTCDSTGYKYQTGDEKKSVSELSKRCEECMGTGTVDVTYKGIEGTSDVHTQHICISCLGIGSQMNRTKCNSCNGSGLSPGIYKKTIRFTTSMYQKRSKSNVKIHCVKNQDPAFGDVFIKFVYSPLKKGK
jgi:hypothetical protein